MQFNLLDCIPFSIEVGVGFSPLNFNPLGFHCQGYSFEKHATQKERHLSEKRNTFVHYNLTLSTSSWTTVHDKQFQMCTWDTQTFAKTVSWRNEQEECVQTSKSVKRVVPGLAAQFLHVTGKLRASKLLKQGRLLSSRKTDFQTILLSRSQLESIAGKRSLPAQQSRHQDKNCVQLYYRAQDGRKCNFRGPKRLLFLQNDALFKASPASLVSPQHAREKRRRCGNHKYQKLRFGCTQVTIFQNQMMESQRVKETYRVLHKKWDNLCFRIMACYKEWTFTFWGSLTSCCHSVLMASAKNGRMHFYRVLC